MAARFQTDLASEKYKSRDSSRDLYFFRIFPFQTPADPGSRRAEYAGLVGTCKSPLQIWCRPLRSLNLKPHKNKNSTNTQRVRGFLYVCYQQRMILRVTSSLQVQCRLSQANSDRSDSPPVFMHSHLRCHMREARQMSAILSLDCLDTCEAADGSLHKLMPQTVG